MKNLIRILTVQFLMFFGISIYGSSLYPDFNEKTYSPSIVKDKIILKFKDKGIGKAEFILLDSEGNLLMKQRVINGYLSVNVDLFPKGHYTVLFRKDGETIAKKIKVE